MRSDGIPRIECAVAARGLRRHPPVLRQSAQELAARKVPCAGRRTGADDAGALVRRARRTRRWPDAVRIDDLYELACWLAGAGLYIGNDSGITHLAAAVGTPVLAFFGPTDPEVWAPRGPHVRMCGRLAIT